MMAHDLWVSLSLGTGLHVCVALKNGLVRLTVEQQYGKPLM